MSENRNIVLEIGDFLGFCDLNGVEAIQTEQVQQLEEYISTANEARRNGDDLIPDAIWDRLMEILRTVNPDSELCKYIWEDSVDELDDTDVLFRKNPMFSIQTIKSFDCDELQAFIKRLPDYPFTAHISVKLNGHGIRLKFKNGDFINARSRARSSAGRDITEQCRVMLETAGLTHIDELESFDLCEVRGEWLLPFSNLEIARQYNPDIKSAFSGVASMGRDSASEEEWNLLRFVGYEFIADDMHFQTKSEEYEFLDELGFETPVYWTIPDLSKANLLEALPDIVADCETEIKPDEEHGIEGYAYYTDGLVFTIDDNDMFRELGDDGTHYKYGNMALKVGYWEQNILSRYVQAILWTKGKSKLSPVAIVADQPDVIQFKDPYYNKTYFFNQNEVDTDCWKNDLGVISPSGNKVRRIPLYEPSNLVVLDAYPSRILHFRYGGEAGVVPCFEDGTPLLDGRIRNMLAEDY